MKGRTEQVSFVHKGQEKKDSFDERRKVEGCTATIVLLANERIYCANAGDSRTVLCRDGKAIEMSHDHKPTDENEKARIEAAGGMVIRDRVDCVLSLSRSIGDHAFKDDEKLKPEEQKVCATPDIKVENFTKNDQFIIVACDGIWDCKSSQEGCDDIAKGIAARKAGEPQHKVIADLLDSILSEDPDEKGAVGNDNMTCLVIEFKHK